VNAIETAIHVLRILKLSGEGTDEDYQIQCIHFPDKWEGSEHYVPIKGCLTCGPLRLAQAASDEYAILKANEKSSAFCDKRGGRDETSE